MLVLHLLIAVAIALVLVIRFKISPVFGLILGGFYYGIASGVGAMKTAGLIAEGFGGTMRGIGLTVGFGVIIGQLLADCGGVQRIVKSTLSVFSARKVPEALCTTGLIVSTPVFFDVGFIILTPIAKKLGKAIKAALPIVIAPLVIGLGTAHMLIPPTPGPLAVADTLKVPLGQMILGGVIVGAPAAFLALYAYNFLAKRQAFWNPDQDEEPSLSDAKFEEIDEKNLPSLPASLLPIAVPVILIVLASIVPIAFKGQQSAVIDTLKFIGERNVAMLLGAVAALFVAYSRMNSDQVSKSVNVALADAGLVLLVTGAGGSFGQVLGATNIGKVLAQGMISYNVPAILLAWFIAAAIKFAQGSGTVAIITTANLIAPVAAQLGLSGIWLALAIGSGALLGCHVNDSAFWVVAKIAGLNTRGAFKAYTLPTAINAITTLIIILVLSPFLWR
ncbi:MAG: GntP family permease [Firmicutes bacterium]|nr:GntP family permease [Bacillota bacterium]